MSQTTTSQRDLDRQRFGLEVHDANGEQLSPVACPSCGQEHDFVVKTKKVPTISFVNPFEERVTARILLNGKEIQSVILKPGESYRIFGDQIDLQNLPPTMWGGKVEVIFRKIIDPDEVELAESELYSALMGYARSVKFEKPEVLAQAIEISSKDIVDHSHNGLIMFEFYDEETWNMEQEPSFDADYYLTVALLGGPIDMGALINDPRFVAPSKKNNFEA